METKKLTAKDLMIGDWVSINNKPHKVTGIQICDGIMCVQTDYTDTYYSIENYEPIPLTAEILEKNGFYFGYTSRQEDAASLIGCSCEKAWTYDEGGGSIQVTFPNECDGGLIVLDDQDFDKNLEFVFANQIYVHELQHALRLCGIDKEITL